MNEQPAEYDFALLLGGLVELTDEVEDALFEAGCDDATLSFQYGGARLDFSRRANSLQEAILSAINDVCSAKLKLVILQVDECDLVTQAEIARRIDRTRQAVNQYIAGSRGPGGFPPPVCHIHDDASLWRWCEVSYWLSSHDMIPKEQFCDAELIAAINHFLEGQQQMRRNPDLLETVSKSITTASECGCG
jgi:hypothetical protein